jgi:hypothetical protein
MAANNGKLVAILDEVLMFFSSMDVYKKRGNN